MKQKQLSDYFNVTKCPLSQGVTKKILTLRRDPQECSQQVISQSDSSFTPTRKPRTKSHKTRVKKSPKMFFSPSQLPRRVSDSVIVISDDEEDIQQSLNPSDTISLEDQSSQKSGSSENPLSNLLDSPSARIVREHCCNSSKYEKKRLEAESIVLKLATKENSFEDNIRNIFPIDSQEVDIIDTKHTNEERSETSDATEILLSQVKEEFSFAENCQNSFSNDSQDNNFVDENRMSGESSRTRDVTNILLTQATRESSFEEKCQKFSSTNSEEMSPVVIDEINKLMPSDIQDIILKRTSGEVSSEDNDENSSPSNFNYEYDDSEDIEIFEEKPTIEEENMETNSFLRVKSVNCINNSVSTPPTGKSNLNISTLSNRQIDQNTCPFEKSASCALPSTPVKSTSKSSVKTLFLKRPREPSSSPIRSHNFASPTKKLSPTSSAKSSPKKSPKSPTKSPSSNRHRRAYNPRKIFPESQEESRIVEAVENLNLFKQNVITPNNFVLSDIYSTGKFVMQYGSLNTGTLSMYDHKDINIPKSGNYQDKDAERLFMAIIDVFANPINCGYFNEDELNRIFSILTLSVTAQVLFARLIKRKIRWIRVRDILNESNLDLIEAHVKELTDRELLELQSHSENIGTEAILRPMFKEELSRICKMMKVPHNTPKQTMINELVKLSTRKPLFSGMKSPSKALKEAIDAVNGECVKVSDLTMHLISRVITLLYPTQDPEEGLTDAFFLLHRVHFSREKHFPETPQNRYPIFKNRSHLIDYMNAKDKWKQFLKLSQQKNKDYYSWEQVRKLGRSAKDHLSFILYSEEQEFQTAYGIPSHIRRFMPIYVWGKILAGSVDAFKKLAVEESNEVVEILQFLIDNRSKIQGKFIKWYSELAMVETNRQKNLEKAAKIVLEALSIPNLSDPDINEMVERARILATRIKNISSGTKERMQDEVDSHASTFIFSPKEIVIEAVMMQGHAGNKSVWQLEIGGWDKGYTIVEKVAIQHYMLKDNLPRGIHCEGSLPMTLFACFFWEEIYSIPVPGAFVCPYQSAPLDVYGSKFIENREEEIEQKLEDVAMWSEEEFSERMMDNYQIHQEYDCLIMNVVDDPQDFRDIVRCLGKNAVTEIVRKFAEGLSIWKAGFPDLFLWNPTTGQCKVVEVKGPGDILSIKQKLWINFLEKHFVPVEVCHVRDVNRF